MLKCLLFLQRLMAHEMLLHITFVVTTAC